MISKALLLLISLALSGLARAQSGRPVWQPVATPDNAGPAGPEAGIWFELDAPQLLARLAAAPPETRPAEAVTLPLPYPDGTLHRFALTRVPVLAPALAAKYPEIQTYAGRALDEADPTAIVRLETMPAGVHATIITAAGTWLIEADAAVPGRYRSFAQPTPPLDCQTVEPAGTGQKLLGGTPQAAPAPYGTQLRTLRLALATTGEYAQRFGGGTVAGTLGTLATIVSSLNAVYERDFALRLELIATNNLIIFLDGATDPYDATSALTLLNGNVAALNAVAGLGTFDIGHVISSLSSGGYSGVAGVGVVCGSQRARASSTASSVGLMTTVLRHEIGHQLGSGHTFNGDMGNCGNNNRSSTLAYEPGAGNTIMSYSGRCNPDNVGSGIVFFHGASIGAIMPRLTCGSPTTTGNRVPVITSITPSTYTIPQGTPFALAASATDADGDALTYSWEGLDRGIAGPYQLATAATDPNAPPLFRSFAPVAGGTRTFPQLSAILNNSNPLSNGEILPLVARPLNFRLTVRDNHAGGGAVTSANVALTVAGTGPFRVTAPAAAFSARPLSPYTVTWDVAGSDVAPIGAPNVQILFSSDGGQNFNTVLLASTPNDGSQQVMLPNVLTTRGRLKIQPLNNVFFALNSANFTLSGTPLPVELTSFTAEACGETARLAWTTASEKDNAGFAVEASADGRAFRRLGWVAGAGSSSAPRRYAFTDGTLRAYPGPVAYYRLRQTDTDGTESFSQVRAVAVPATRVARLTVWPNPARGRVLVAGLAPGTAVRVLDLTGRVLLAAAMPAAGPLELPVSVAPGVYVVRGGGQARRLAVE